ncbi:MAG: hypothetical protein ACOYB4_09555 [Methyloceanibacter sp.]
MALAIVMLACLGGCGGGSASFMSGATSFLGSPKIAIAPIVGAPPPVVKELTEALVVAGKERKLTLIPGSGGNYTMRGYLLASSEMRGARISFIWDVTDTKGARVVRIAGDETVPSRSGSDPWSKVDSTVIRNIANKTASQLAAGIRGGGSPAPAVAAATPRPAATPVATAAAPAAAAAVSTRSSGVLVTPVSGAPGDGQRSLTTALKKRLYAGGIKLANGPATNVYTVKGIAKLSNASGGKQNIRIDWQVLDPSGKKLGTVSQQNTIPKGSLDGPWGAIADAAARAAVDGIIKLLPKSS